MTHNFNIESASTVTLLEVFNFVNRVVDPNATAVKKFADRKTAVRRVTKALADFPSEWEGSPEYSVDAFRRDLATMFGVVEEVVATQEGPMIVNTPIYLETCADCSEPWEVQLHGVNLCYACRDARQYADDEKIVLAEPTEPTEPLEPTESDEVVARVIERSTVKPAFEANPFQTEFLQALVNLLENGRPSDVTLGDVNMQLSKRAKSGSGAQAISSALKVAGIVAETEAGEDDPSYLWITLEGNEYCKRAGIVKQEAYKASGQRDPELAATQTKATKATKPAKEPKAPKEPRVKDVTFTYHPNPAKRPHAVRASSKIATIVDLISRPQGATMAELQVLMSPKSTVRAVLQYDLNALVGYGCHFDGTAVRILFHTGMTAALPHKVTEQKVAKKVAE